ncbi:MAG TPA: DUF1015 domain-containing protein [Nitrospiraceae bacterium]|jgi:uncharacterized protein (DUF1015 family)
MANLIPFRGVLYNPAKVPDISRVVAPPYDVIDAAFQKALHARHPHNVIRLELGLDEPQDSPGQNRYTRAAGLLKDWLAAGVLERERAPAIYPYMIDYRSPLDATGAPPKTLKGFFSSVELEEFGTGKIYPHENTRAAAKTDRLNLLEACGANFSAIFSLFSDPKGAVVQLIDKSVNADKPRFEFTDDEGFRQRLWAITDRSVLNEIVAFMKSTPLFIADGHHRYETALNYRRTRREQAGAAGGVQPYDAVLMLFASLEDPGLTVLPTHRVLTTPVPPLPELMRLFGETCDVEEVPAKQFLQTLRTRGQAAPVFGMALRGASSFLLLSVKPAHRPKAGASERDKLDVSLLQTLVLNKLCPKESDQHALIYTKDHQEALDLVAQGKATASLLLNPTKVGEVRAVAAAGERMPHKSTYFFPKQLTGLVMNVMEG